MEAPARALVAPSVVLTAGHCVAGFSSFRVSCPYLNQESPGSGEVHPNYKVGPSGSICQRVIPASPSTSRNRCASGPNVPMPPGQGSDVGWSRMPAERGKRMATQVEGCGAALRIP